MSLVDGATAPIVFNLGSAGVAAANPSTTWQIQNVQLICDLTTLDSGLNDSCIKLFEKGKKHTLKYNTFISQDQTIINQTDFSVNIDRSLTRLITNLYFMMEGIRSSSKQYYCKHHELECFVLQQLLNQLMVQCMSYKW